MLNPLRLGFIRVLVRMGVSVAVHEDAGLHGPETVGSIVVASGSELGPVHVASDEVPSLIDELPLLVLVAAFTRGQSRFDGLAELRVKESDRFAAIVRMLQSLGVPHEEDVDSLALNGDPDVRPTAPLDAEGDHRIAMAHAILALRCGWPISADPCVAVSWPGFDERLRSLVA